MLLRAGLYCSDAAVTALAAPISLRLGVLCMDVGRDPIAPEDWGGARIASRKVLACDRLDAIATMDRAKGMDVA